MIEERSDYFLLAYDSPTFSAAAAKIPMTPQGFTKIIKNLERDLGVPLFATDDHGVRRPTPYADEYYQYAKRMQAAREQLGRAFERISNEGQVNLNVACAVGIPGLFSADTLQGYSKKHPNVSIAFSELPDNLCESLVKDGYFDIGISVQPVDSALDSHNLMVSEVMMWVNADNPLSKRAHLTFDDLVGERIAMPGKEFHIYDNFRRTHSELGLACPEIVEYAEIFWCYYFALSGKGMGFTLPHLASLDIFSHSEDVVAVPLRGIEWQVCLAWPKDQTLTAYEQGYLDYLKRAAKRAHEKRS